jgi:hypothetical protein
MVIPTPVMRIQRSGVVEWTTTLDDLPTMGDKWLRETAVSKQHRSNMQFEEGGD